MTDRKARLLFIAHDTEKSGAPRVTLELARGLAERGWAVRVCFPRTGELEEEARRAGVETVIVENPPVSLARSDWGTRLRIGVKRLAALPAYWSAARGADVVWAGSAMMVLGGLAGKLAGRPVVYHVHELLAPTRGNRVRAALIRRTGTDVVFVAEESQKFFGERPASQRWHVVPNFIDGSKIDAVRHEDAARLRRELGASEGDVVFLTAAFLTPRKGIDVLLRAFERFRTAVPNARLWIAGGDVAESAAWAKEQRALATQIAPEGSIRFLGHRDDVAALMRASDVFVLASRNEALPLSIAEAMHSARPVIATNVGSVPSMVENEKNGLLVPPENAEALAAAMETYARDEAWRKADGARGREWALVLYNRAAVLDRVEGVLRGCMADKSVK